MIIYSCSVGSVTQAEGGVRSSACPGLWAEKSIMAVLFLLPQDRVNAVYLVIRMLFLAFFFFPWLSLFSWLPCCCPAGGAGSGGRQERGAGSTSIPPLPHAEPSCAALKLKITALALQQEVNPWQEETRGSTGQLSDSWVSPRTKGSRKAWHELLRAVLPSLPPAAQPQLSFYLFIFFPWEATCKL